MSPVTESGAANTAGNLIKGMYYYMADAGLIVDCRTGKKYPVAQAGDNAALEAAYIKARKSPGEPVLVSLQGRIVSRSKMEGSGKEEAVMVDRFIKTSPGETCDQQQSSAQFEKTQWNLIELNGKPVIAASDRQEANILINPEGKRL